MEGNESPVKSTIFTQSDAIAMLRLAVLVAQQPPGLKSRGIPLLQGLCENLSTRRASLFVIPPLSPSSTLKLSLVHSLAVGKDKDELAMRTESMARSCMLVGPHGLGTEPSNGVIAWSELFEGDQDQRAPMGGHFLCSLRLNARAPTLCLTFHRFSSQGRFTEREVAFVQSMHHSYPLGDSAGDGVERIPTLPPRCAEVFKLLGEGLSEKEISNNLRIGISTVHTHVRSLYERLGIRSRGELISLWFREYRRPARSGCSAYMRRSTDYY